MEQKKTTHCPITMLNGRKVLDYNRFSSHHIQSIANSKRRAFSKILRKRYGIGVVEWRLIAGLAREPDIPASQLSEFTLTDKGQVSKALTSLENKGLITLVPKTSTSPRMKYKLTQRGDDLHDDFLPLLLEREASIFADSSEAEIELFFKMMKRVIKNLDRFNAEKLGTDFSTNKN